MLRIPSISWRDLQTPEPEQCCGAWERKQLTTDILVDGCSCFAASSGTATFGSVNCIVKNLSHLFLVKIEPQGSQPDNVLPL